MNQDSEMVEGKSLNRETSFGRGMGRGCRSISLPSMLERNRIIKREIPKTCNEFVLLCRSPNKRAYPSLKHREQQCVLDQRGVSAHDANPRLCCNDPRERCSPKMA